jgi:hypothetical protein
VPVSVCTIQIVMATLRAQQFLFVTQQKPEHIEGLVNSKDLACAPLSTYGPWSQKSVGVETLDSGPRIVLRGARLSSTLVTL